MGIWCLEMATGNCGCGQDWQVVIASISPATPPRKKVVTLDLPPENRSRF
jgi:hypothetical protein